MMIIDEDIDDDYWWRWMMMIMDDLMIIDDDRWWLLFMMLDDYWLLMNNYRWWLLIMIIADDTLFPKQSFSCGGVLTIVSIELSVQARICRRRQPQPIYYRYLAQENTRETPQTNEIEVKCSRNLKQRNQF